ncbi:hypothetical protein SLEP1_g15205 [Rubroshorea leprosula]|uniref:Uncharacterized protein n=1 Tax=Rubroshorea leprosula TaxID=152421 RepID=A0AAV5IQX1_9ROSI|nr:hypothetical protein SLEP1_g15205 [Rubroshorea leprosula]
MNERVQCHGQAGVRAGPFATYSQQHKVHHRIYAVVRKAGDACEGGGLQVAFPMPFVSVYQRDEVNRLLDYVKARGLVDLETLVTPEQIALLGFVDVANLHSQASLSDNVSELKAQGAGAPGLAPSVNPALKSGHLLHRGAVRSTEVPARRRGRVPSRGLSRHPPALGGARGRSLTQRMTFHSSGVGQVPTRSPPQPLLRVLLACIKRQLARLQRPPPPRRLLRAKGHVQQHGGHAALIKLMDAFSYTVALFECEQGARAQNHELQKSCKQLATEKASLTDEVSRLQSSEMADRAASAESRADELACKVDELKEELVRAQVEKESGIQAAKEELGRAEERAKKAEFDREKTLHELSSLKERVVQADQYVAQAEASLESTKRAHQRDVCFARAQGAEWLSLFTNDQ